MVPVAEEIARLIAAKGNADPTYFLKYFLPHWFPDTIPWFHKGIISVITRRTQFLVDDPELPRIIENFVVPLRPFDPKSPTTPIFELKDGTLSLNVTRHTLQMLPRGFAKTTVCNGLVLWAAVYNVRRFIVYVSETDTHASMQLGAVKGEIETNERIHSVFGLLRGKGVWREDFIVLNNGVALTARGRGAQIRGMLYLSQRPDLIIFDDVEDRESVKTAEQRQKAKQWCYSDVLPALPRRDHTSGLNVLATLLHSEALAVTLANDPRFTSIIFGAKDRQGNLLWPAHMGEAELETEKLAFTKAGQLSSFYLEYFNTVRDDSSAKFRQEFIRYEPHSREEFDFVSLACDPAISNKPDASFFALGVVGITRKGLVCVLDVWGGIGVTPREQVDRYFALWERWQPTHCGVESIAYQAALVHLLREEMFRRSKNGKRVYHEITPLTNTKKKEERVEGILQPRYAAGYIVHARAFPLLESQLLDWPAGKKDFPDVIAMAVSLLDDAAPQAAEGDLGEDEYTPLEDWRQM